MKAKVLAAVVAAAVVVGGGAVALTRLLGAADDEALAFVPSDSFLYANVFIRPSNDQKSALDNLLQKFPGIDSTEDAIRKITELLDDALEDEGLSYEEDVDPWLGDQMAAFMMPGGTIEVPNVAVLVETKDEEALRDFIDETTEKDDVELEEKTYEDVTYEVADVPDPFAFTIVDGFFVGGTEEALKAAIDTHAGEETLETTRRFTDATAPLNEDWIGLFYLDFTRLFEELNLDEQLTPQDRIAFEALDFEDQQPAAAILYAEADAVVFEASGGMPSEGAFAELADLTLQPGLVPELPAESWAALGAPELGKTFGAVLDFFAGLPGLDRVQLGAMFYAETGLRLEQDVLSWMGDFGIFVQGENLQEIGGGAVVESKDPAKTEAFVQKLEDLVAEQGLRPEDASLGGLDGFSIQMPGMPAPVFALGGDRLVLAYGQSATEAAAGEGETLAESEAFQAAQDAVGDDFDISFFVDVDAAQAFGEAVAGFQGAPDDVYQEDVKPYIDVLTHLVVAAKKEGDTAVQKFVVGVE